MKNSLNFSWPLVVFILGLPGLFWFALFKMNVPGKKFERNKVKKALTQDQTTP